MQSTKIYLVLLALFVAMGKRTDLAKIQVIFFANLQV